MCLCLGGCFPIAPGSRPYTPSDGGEKEIFSQVRRDVFPDDVRGAPEQYKSTIVLWSAIIRNVAVSDSSVTITFEHHYWDFIEDYSVQKAIAFLSPRGEGRFVASFPLSTKVSVGDMALVYGMPEDVDTNGVIVLSEKGMRTLPQPLYATDVWDYGRAYLLKHDMSDFKVLRVPLR
jgi:hypothetical protein